MVAEPGGSGVKHLGHRGPRDDVPGGSGGLAGLGEQTHDWHRRRLLPTYHRATVRPVTQLLVVRHGQSEWNADGRWQGQEDPPLTGLGRSQAVQAARAVGAVEGIFASPLDRAATTAEIIGAELGVGPVVTLAGLMERRAGVWQGLTRDQIERDFPGYLAGGRRPPGWEPDDRVRRRVFTAFDAIAAAHRDGAVLAVAHAGVIFSAEAALGAPWERLANLGGRWFQWTHGAWVLGDRVHLLTEETIPDQL